MTVRHLNKIRKTASPLPEKINTFTRSVILHFLSITCYKL